MRADWLIRAASPDDAPEVAVMVGELLAEIMDAIGEQAFHFDLPGTRARLRDYIAREKYFVFVGDQANLGLSGFVALTESHALYTEGTFGTLPEFYVRPAYRSKGVGRQLLAQAKSFAASRGWSRLEVTTPPLPWFDRTLAFYEREGFAISGGRKLKLGL